MSEEVVGGATGARQLVRGGLLVAISLGLGQVLAYAQTLVAARVLSPNDFGAFSALLALIMIGNTVALAAQAVTARHIVRSTENPGGVTASAWRVTTIASAITLAIWLALSPIILQVLRIESWLTVIAMAAGFLPLTLLGGALGIAQGHEQHGRLAMVYINIGVIRNLVAIAFLALLGTLAASMSGMAVGAAIGAFGAWLVIRGLMAGQPPIPTSMLREIPAATYTLLALFTVTNLDIVLARIFLGDTESGEYAVGVIVAKIATWLPQFVAVMAYARMADQRRGRTTMIGLGMVVAIGAAVTVTVALAHGYLVTVIAGEQYADISGKLPVFALIGACAAVLQFVVFGMLAVADKGFIRRLWLGSAVLTVCVAVWHSSVTQVALTMLAVLGTLAVIGSLRLLREREAVPVDEPVG